MITSLKNDRVRLVRALQERRRIRQRERRFVIEGLRLCEEATRAGAIPHFAFFTDEVHEDPRARSVMDAWTQAGVVCELVSAAVMATCSSTETPQGLLAVVPLPNLSRPTQPTLTLILDRLRDPGNLGALLRTALAAGVDQVLLAPGTVDATNPKAVRAAMGAHFRLPVAALEWPAIQQATDGCHVYLAEVGGAIPYTEVNWQEPVALIIGGEAAGAGEQARALADAQIVIPLLGDVESLNTAAAAAVLLFEAVRQRRAAGCHLLK